MSRTIKLTPQVAAGLSEQHDKIYEVWSMQQKLADSAASAQQLELPMTARKVTSALRGLQELHASGELAALIATQVRAKYPELNSDFGQEMMRQHARSMWSYYFPPDDSQRERLEERLDTWGAAIAEALGDVAADSAADEEN